MNDIQFFQTKMGRQYYEVTMPELVREIHQLNDLLALSVESVEGRESDRKPIRKPGHEKDS